MASDKRLSHRHAIDGTDMNGLYHERDLKDVEHARQE